MTIIIYWLDYITSVILQDILHFLLRTDINKYHLTFFETSRKPDLTLAIQFNIMSLNPV